MLEQSSSDGSNLAGGNGSSIGSSEFHSGQSQLSSRASSIGTASVDANKIRAIENAIDQNDWKEVSELASSYKELNNAASPDVDMEKMKEEYSPVAAAMAEAGKWQAIAEANEPKSNEASEAASWAINRSLENLADDAEPEKSGEV
mmetsp:Transcript_37821/g.76965  ORF Transcript_37821/g.76965 Transcript_37821/m.76965 type:complete len:146 (+) Transcript_37821:252-689(+)